MPPAPEQALEPRPLETFLQEQPTLIFGRTARELLILLAACSLTYSLWLTLAPLSQPLTLLLAELVLLLLVLLVGLLVALLKVQQTYHLEDWLVLRLAYALLPKISLYEPERTREPGGAV